MTGIDLAISSRRVVLSREVSPATVLIAGGVIQAVVPYGESGGARERIDAGAAVVMPGIVDPHVHINEPGRTEWEGFETATAAAAAGGVTTLVDMPLNCSPVTTSVGALHQKAEAARGKCRVDYGFWGGVVPGNQSDLVPLLDAGVLGFKCFLVHSGLDEFPNVDEDDLRRAMPVLAERGAVLLVHAELPALIEHRGGNALPHERREYRRYLASRPRQAEIRAVDLLIDLCREYHCAVHIVHLSSADALASLRAGRAAGLPLTVETCPHYLTFAAEAIPDGATEFKCAPPIRERENRERLWLGLRDGVVDLIATDHSPCPPDLKCGGTGDFLQAWGGVSSLQLTLPAVWTGARARGHSLGEVAAWLCQRPARLAGLARRKGQIAPGLDADLVIWDPDPTFVVEPAKLRHRHRLTPYAGMTLHGTVRATFVRGVRVYDADAVCSNRPGRWLGRESG